MITSILFLIIGVELNMLKGWYLGLIIFKIIMDFISFGVRCIKTGMGE